MIWLKDNEQGGYDFSRNEPKEYGWFQVFEDDVRIDLVGYKDKTWIQKRLASLAEGGYGTWHEQLEIMNEQGFDAWQKHCAQVKESIKKE